MLHEMLVTLVSVYTALNEVQRGADAYSCTRYWDPGASSTRNVYSVVLLVLAAFTAAVALPTGISGLFGCIAAVSERCAGARARTWLLSSEGAGGGLDRERSVGLPSCWVGHGAAAAAAAAATGAGAVSGGGATRQ